ncbi:MAG: hypothetical protein LBW77_06335 [Verrucomicrobiota bacterium]|jgi:hypothetical protein|nr:hypothetical protein [Verrucomicrobiota bacterium]
MFGIFKDVRRSVGWRTGRGARVCGFALCCAVGLPSFAPAETAPEAPAAPVPDEVVSRFRLGPFFEYRATREGGTFWAVRPFYSKVIDPVSDTRVTDVVWPLSTFHRDREQAWWRFLLAYGKDDDVARDDSAWSVSVLPFWFQGRTREGEDYWALFPIYGHLPHVLLMEDINFVLFPFYLDFEVNGLERVHTPWLLHSHLTENPNVSEHGIFPFWCRQENNKYQVDRLYAFWPFWTSAVYRGERNPGSSFIFFPFYGEVNREKETQRLVLPPLFSHAQTDSAERWRLPWPFYETQTTRETATTKASRKRSYWPVYGDFTGGDETRWYAAWPLIDHSVTAMPRRRVEQNRFFPFYRSEVTYRRDAEGVEREASRYTRVWPLYERDATPEASRLRVLALSPIRYSGGIERNWAPFWTVYEREAAGGGAAHDALWGLLKFHTGRAGAAQEDGR